MQPDESVSGSENPVITIEEFIEQESSNTTHVIPSESVVREDEEENGPELEDQSDDASVHCRCCF